MRELVKIQPYIYSRFRAMCRDLCTCVCLCTHACMQIIQILVMISHVQDRRQGHLRWQCRIKTIRSHTHVHDTST
jgi:hypothetical protein